MSPVYAYMYTLDSRLSYMCLCTSRLRSDSGAAKWPAASSTCLSSLECHGRVALQVIFLVF